jgi:hypothetical protein
VVEVFKTNITAKKDAKKIINALKILLPLAKIKFDLDDYDNILRIEDESISPKVVIDYLLSNEVEVVKLD